VIVRSFGTLTSYDPNLSPVLTAGAPRTVPPAGVWTLDGDPYAVMYRTQPAVRTCVDFLARNIAQVALHVFRRISDTDRERLAGHQLANWLERPAPGVTRYRLFESLMQDIGIYFAAYWLKVRRTDGDIGLVRLPPSCMAVDGWLIPSTFLWTLPTGEVTELDPADVVYFHGYNPDDPISPLSPLETLRARLAEEAAAGAYRVDFWNNAARLEGVIERPGAAPRWTADQKMAFREQWTARYAGSAGQTAVLEDGMTWKSVTANAQESEYLNARKLTREEVAAAYHIPLPMVGILDHATFSNISEQHKQLYQDSLGPPMKWISEEIEQQLLPECRDTADVYTEFNIAEKLKGSFEEQANALQKAVGRPIMTANEGRARLNLPRVDDDATADELVLPLNQSTATTRPAPVAAPIAAPDAEADVQLAADDLTPVLKATFGRQWNRLEKVPPRERAGAFDLARWDRELAADLLPLYLALDLDMEAASAHATALAERINTDTLRRLVDGVAHPFSGREATYV
jgi:HK97 family phage portal protein